MYVRMYVHRQPGGAIGCLQDRVGRMGWQVQAVTRLEFHGLTIDLKCGFTLEQDHPFVLVLHIVAWPDERTADDALDHHIASGQQGIEALPLGRRQRVIEQVAQRRHVARSSSRQVVKSSKCANASAVS